jgi:hypothetical protein
MPCDNESPIKNICISPTQQQNRDWAPLKTSVTKWVIDIIS